MMHETMRAEPKSRSLVQSLVLSCLLVFVALGMVVGTAQTSSAADMIPMRVTEPQYSIPMNVDPPQVTPDIFVTMTTPDSSPRQRRPVTYTITITSAGLSYRGVPVTGENFPVYIMYNKFWGEFLALTVVNPPDPNFMCLPKNQGMSVNGGPGRRDANGQLVLPNAAFQIDCGLVINPFPLQLSPGFELRAGTSVQILVTLNAPFRDPDGWAYENEINIATYVTRIEDKTNNRAVVYIWPDY